MNSCSVPKGTPGIGLISFYKYFVPKGTGVLHVLIS